ncbi:MAG: hypothetical protein JWQ03_940 [Variovorax sp.]|nr:hypothetical protein [Variovorax sp.]
MNRTLRAPRTRAEHLAVARQFDRHDPKDAMRQMIVWVSLFRWAGMPA